MRKRKVAVIGGGAAGIAAALTAASNGAEVTIFERNDRIGKKILATGNGKCNLSNKQMFSACFHTLDEKKLEECLERFGVQDTINFFKNLGLMIKDKNGYLYPASEQAAVVLDVLRIGVARSGICVKTEAKVTEIRGLKTEFNNKGNSGRGSFGTKIIDAKSNDNKSNDNKSDDNKSNDNKSIDKTSFDKEKITYRFEVYCGKDKECFDKVIITCGSNAAPKTGSDGNGYELAKTFGHNIIPVVPSLVQLKCSDSFCKSLAGIRSEACVHIFEDGKALCQENGEVQLTDYGISGIPVFQLSALVNRRLADKKHGEITAVIDFLPGLSDEEFISLQKERMLHMGDLTAEEFFTGMLNKKLMMLFIKLAGLNPTVQIQCVSKNQVRKVFGYCKRLEYHITGHNGFENAQVCAGGVDLREMTSDLESKKTPGLFFAGEILDVDGRCGGYNLQWAWTSGCIAGKGVCK